MRLQSRNILGHWCKKIDDSKVESRSRRENVRSDLTLVEKPLSPPIARELTRLLMDIAIPENDPPSAALYGVSYASLLRVPSEGSPLRITVSRPGVILICKTLVLSASEDVLHLDRRNNRGTVTVAARLCWCAACRHTCPVHSLLPLVAWADVCVAAPPSENGDSIASRRLS